MENLCLRWGRQSTGVSATLSAMRGAYLPFDSHNYFGAVRLHLNTAVAHVPIGGRQPRPGRRFVAAVYPETFFFERFASPTYQAQARPTLPQVLSSSHLGLSPEHHRRLRHHGAAGGPSRGRPPCPVAQGFRTTTGLITTLGGATLVNTFTASSSLSTVVSRTQSSSRASFVMPLAVHT